MHSLENWIQRQDTKLYLRYWIPDKPPVATLVAIHGLGEHISRYDELFTLFANNGIKVCGFDQRGFGQTGRLSGVLGHNQGIETTFSDIQAVSDLVKIEGIPHFIFGHSMGGGLALMFAKQNQDQFDGVVASAPLVRPGHLTYPNPVEIMLMYTVPYVIPWFVIPNKLELSTLTRDPESLQKYLDDPLVHGYISTGLGADLFFKFSTLLEDSSKSFSLPILICHGSKDGMTCMKSAKEFHDLISSKDKTFHEYEGFYHELHNEPEKDRKVVHDRYLKWILSHV